MDSNSANSISIFFRCMGAGFVILCFRSIMINGATLEAMQTFWYTFLYNATIAPSIGLIGMFTVDLYHFIKQKLKSK